jgi:hypothetical protein
MWFDGCARLVANISYKCALISKEQCQSFENAEKGHGIEENLANYVIWFFRKQPFGVGRSLAAKAT